MNGIKLRNISLFKPGLMSSFISNLISAKSATTLLKGLVVFALVIGFSVTDSFAQDRVEVTGVVTDAADGSPLPGASIIVEGSSELTGSTIGTTSGMDGTYSLSVPASLNVLRVSFIGYITQNVDIDGRTEVNIAMQPDVRMLDDVVVVGYGVQDRREITSAVASISSDQFATGNINDPQQLLQGRVAGLSIVRPGSDPSGGYTMRLRGLSTIGANTEPLVVIDGIIGGNLDSVDPRDIESIDVLKDASAAAIYGTRGASGVIMVTTKSGSAIPEGGVSVTYNGEVTTAFVANRTEMMTAEEYRAIPSLVPHATISDFGASTDWWKEVTQNAYNTSHNLSVSGGTGTTSYRLSGNYRYLEGIQRGVTSERFNTRLNVQHRALDDRLTLTGILSITDLTDARGNGDVFRYATTHNPTAPIFNDDGTFREITGFDRFNPVAINRLQTIDEERNRFNVSFRGEYDLSDLIQGVSATAQYSREKWDRFRGEYRSKNLDWGDGMGRNGLAFRESNESRNQLFESYVNYRQTFGNVRVEALTLGYSYQEFEDQGQGANAGDFPSDATKYHNLGLSGDINEGRANLWSYRNTNKLIAGFAVARFVFDNTYFLNSTFRREGSTRFGEGNKWGNFYAISGGLELTNLIDIPRANELRLRVGYGETGTQPQSSGLSQLRFQTQGNFLVDGNFIPALGPASNPNPDLKWEVNRSINFGVDFAFFDNRLTGSLDYYESTTDDALLEFTVPVPPNIFPQQWVNIGQLSNKGFEAQLGYLAIDRSDLSWNTYFTFATNETVLESLSKGDFQFGERALISNVGSPGLNNTPMIRIQEGRPIGEIWGKEFAGISSNGEWLFFSADGDVITAAQSSEADDRVIGNGLPDFEIGFGNTFNYRNWSLDMYWSGAFGHDLANSFNIFYDNPNSAFGWNVKKTATDLAELREDPQFSSFYVEDASYMRLENLTIGYRFDMSASAPIRTLRLYAAGNNLWTITGYTGIDPAVRYEDSDLGGNPLRRLAPGIERRNEWFTQTSLVFGVDIGF